MFWGGCDGLGGGVVLFGWYICGREACAEFWGLVVNFAGSCCKYVLV